MTLALSKKSYLAVAKEATAGVAPAAPTLYVPCKSIMKRLPHHQYISDERGTRDENNDRISLVTDGSTDPKGEFYVDTSPFWMFMALGADTPTQPDNVGAPTAWDHAIRLADVPPSTTLWKSYHSQVYYSVYNVVTKFKVKFTAEKGIEFECSTESNEPLPWGGAALTPTISTVKPFTGRNATLKVNAAASLDIEELEIDFEQKWTKYYNGGASYITAYPGGRHAKVKGNARFDTTTFYDYFRLDTDFRLELIVVGKNLGGAVTEKLDILLPTVGLDTGTDHKLDKENVQLTFSGTARPVPGNDFIQIDAVNTVAAY